MTIEIGSAHSSIDDLRKKAKLVETKSKTSDIAKEVEQGVSKAVKPLTEAIEGLTPVAKLGAVTEGLDAIVDVVEAVKDIKDKKEKEKPATDTFAEIQQQLEELVDKPSPEREKKLIKDRVIILAEAKKAGVLDSIRKDIQIAQNSANMDYEGARTAIAKMEAVQYEVQLEGQGLLRPEWEGIVDHYRNGVLRNMEIALLDEYKNRGLSVDAGRLDLLRRKRLLLGWGNPPPDIGAMAKGYLDDIKTKKVEEIARAQAKTDAASAQPEAGSELAEAMGKMAENMGRTKQPDWFSRENEVAHDESFFNSTFLRGVGIPLTWGRQGENFTWVPVDMVGLLSELADRGKSDDLGALGGILSSPIAMERLFVGRDLHEREKRSLIKEALLPLLLVMAGDDGTIESLAGKEGVQSLLEKNEFNEMKIARLMIQPGFGKVREALGIFFALETPVLGVNGNLDELRSDFDELKKVTKSQELAAKKPTKERLLTRVSGLVGGDCSIGEVAMAFQYFKLFGYPVMNFQYGKLLSEYGEILHGDGVSSFVGVVGSRGEPAIGMVNVSDGRTLPVFGVANGGEVELGFDDMLVPRKGMDDLIKSDSLPVVENGDDYMILENTRLGESWWPIINGGLKVDERYLATYLAIEGVDSFLTAVQRLGGLKLKNQWGDVLSMRTNVGEVGRMVERKGDEYKGKSSGELSALIDQKVDKELRKPPPSTLITKYTADRLKRQRIERATRISKTEQIMNPSSPYRNILRDTPLGKLLRFVGINWL